MHRFFLIGIVFVFIFAITGELTRLPLGPGNGILPNDLLLAILAGSWIFHKTFNERKWPTSKLWVPFFLFVAIAFISLLNAWRGLTLNEFLTSGFYLFRFVEYFFLIFIVNDLRQKFPTSKLFNLLLGSALIIAVLGFLQLQFFPDFDSMQELGWDPHENRLLSTWFDPNFIAGMLAFVICLGLSKKPRPVLAGMILVLLFALLVTYSRSGYLTLIAGVGVLGLLKSRKLLIWIIVLSLILVSVSGRAQDRVQDLYHSAKSMVTDTAELPDATARLRIESWQNALFIFEKNPILGVGYNTYTYVQSDYGFVKKLTNHASSGSDSTLLTILATTGILGFTAYAWLLLTILYIAFQNRKNAMAIGFFAGFCGLLVHSLFVNSLLYSPILIFFYAAFGLIMPACTTSPNSE